VVLAAIEELAKALGGTAVSNNLIRVTRDELEVDYELTHRGEEVAAWTTVSASLPASYPVQLRIERGQLERGSHEVDVELGTPGFDDAFVVVAAPTDVVKILIDEQTRQFLLAQQGAVELEVFRTTLTLRVIDWKTDRAAAIALVDLVARLASRVRAAYAEVDRDASGNPYRPEAGPDRGDVRAQEIEAVRSRSWKEAWRQHRQRDRWFWYVFFGVILMFAVMALVLSPQ
jgi:hypothetical protein